MNLKQARIEKIYAILPILVSFVHAKLFKIVAKILINKIVPIIVIVTIL